MSETSDLVLLARIFMPSPIMSVSTVPVNPPLSSEFVSHITLSALQVSMVKLPAPKAPMPVIELLFATVLANI